MKERLAGVMAIDSDDLRNGITSIFAEMSEKTKIRAFYHWIERCESVAEHNGPCFHVLNNLADFIFVMGIRETDSKDVWGTLSLKGYQLIARRKREGKSLNSH
jgi:hypothetical protein